jgi:type I restriction enzyme, R subunit
MRFTEEKLERAFTELLGQEGFPHHLGITIVRKPDEVLIEEDLQNFLLIQYASYNITINEIKSIILKLKSLSATDLYESNKTFLKMLSDGFILKREDRNQKDIYIQFIDFSGLNNHRQPDAEQLVSIVAEQQAGYVIDNNIYKFVNQLEIAGSEKRIPDGIVYINGLPLGSDSSLYLPYKDIDKEIFSRLSNQKNSNKTICIEAIIIQGYEKLNNIPFFLIDRVWLE